MPVASAIRLRFTLWAVLMGLMLGLLVWRVLPSLQVETDILALLPRAAGDVATSEAVDRFSAALAAKMVLLVGAPQTEQAKQAAQVVANSLRSSRAFAEVRLEQQQLTQAMLSLYTAHRGYLLSQRHTQLLQSAPAELQAEALRAAFTPAGLMRVMTLADDPLGLANDYFMQQLPSVGATQFDGRFLMIHSDAIQYVLITAELAGSPFATPVQEAASAALSAAHAAAERVIAPMQLDVVSSGTMPHAMAARERATAELTTFGTLETLLVMALLVAVFSAVRPLVLGVLTMSLAFIAGIVAVHFAFGSVHVLALVFGSSLIGGVIDYSIHFFADRFRGDAHWTPAVAVDHVGGAIMLGCATTLLGYVVLLVVPFPGLRQIALFCMAGLTVGCGTVLCAYPVLYRAPRRGLSPNKKTMGPQIGAWLARGFASFIWTPQRLLVAVLLLLASLAGVSQIFLQDDVRALQSSPAELIAAEQRMAMLLQSGIESRYFLVQGDTEQAVLAAEGQLTQQLDGLRSTGKLKSYTAVSHALPSLRQQRQSHDLLSAQVTAAQGLLPALLQQLGFAADDIAKRRRAFMSSTPLQVNEWLASEASRPYRDLWLGELNGRYASIVTLAGIKDIEALQKAAQNLHDVRLIDRVAAVSDVLRSYRQVMSWLLGLVYVLAMGLLSVKYGWREAPLLLLPSALASGVTLGLFGWFGVPVNLFTLLALWLVLGLGVDYGIFLRHGRTALPTAVLSVSLSAVTTLLAFGMLAFSATPFIRSIGLTLLCAISLSWLFAALSCLTLEKQAQEISHD